MSERRSPPGNTAKRQALPCTVKQQTRVQTWRNGKPLLVAMSPDELEGWEETLALEADPGALARIARGEAEIAAGQYIGARELRADYGLLPR